ncbi:hypothetical protein HYZ82_02235 [Candidatus Nomurabacteria bacterium]|nr:hypothetical protein [Candidatus Nomurabacteria bacterium]
MKVYLIVIKGKNLLLVRKNLEDSWDIPCYNFDGEPNRLRIEMAMVNFFSEISIKEGKVIMLGEKDLEDSANVIKGNLFCLCFTKESLSRAHEFGKTWFASKYNLPAPTLTELANAVANLPLIQSRLL